MPVDITFKDLPAGYAETSARGVDKVKVSQFGFCSSEDGDEFIRKLEGLPQQIISLIPSSFPILPSMVNTLLAIIHKDKTAKVYLNEIKLLEQVRVKKDVKKGDLITLDHILDIGKMNIPDVSIPNNAGIVFVFSVGWRKGFLYDLVPLHGASPRPRQYDVEELIGSLFSYLMFQERFKIDDNTWEIILDQKWFPFAHLDNEIVKQMISHAGEGWDIDELLPKITDNVKRLLKDNNPAKKSFSYITVHSEIFEKAFERYINEDYISCTSILYPRIEGLLRSFFRAEGYEEKPTDKTLSKAAIVHHEKNRISYSLLLPSKFNDYLNNIYFANFVSGSMPDVSRHSVAHGEARPENFDLKASTIAILIIYQLTLFLSSGKKDKDDVEQAAAPDL